jgi:isopenicillin N synthase-like dioxygenase
MTISQPPMIDLRSATPAALVEGLADAACVLITGHGVAPSLVDDMVRTAKVFFDQPDAAKAAVEWPGDGAWRGWLAIQQGRKDIIGDRPPDLHEKFEVMLPADAWSRPGDPGDAFDLWPAEPADFRQAWVDYYGAMRGLANRLVGMLVDALELPADDVPAWTDQHYANLVVNDYVAQTEPPEPGQTRVGAHVDRGGLTLLWGQNTPGGLQVEFPGTDTWCDVAIPPDCFLLQVGELLAHWTNQVIPANRHRVPNPPRGEGPTSRRFSVVYFHYPDLETEVRPAPSWLRADTNSDAAMHAGRHLLYRQENYRNEVRSVS